MKKPTKPLKSLTKDELLRKLKYQRARSTKLKGKNEKLSGLVEKLFSDRDDMLGAVQTIFYRCSCGHMREEGIRCINEECPVRYD